MFILVTNFGSNETLLLQTKADNQGIQNEGQIAGTITAGFKIFQLLDETIKATDFKGLHVNCWEINP